MLSYVKNLMGIQEENQDHLVGIGVVEEVNSPTELLESSNKEVCVKFLFNACIESCLGFISRCSLIKCRVSKELNPKAIESLR